MFMSSLSLSTPFYTAKKSSNNNEGKEEGLGGGGTQAQQTFECYDWRVGFSPSL